MRLVILAAGFGRRFGGLKQLAPVGPNGEAIMDYTASAAQSCGYDGIVLVVREDIQKEIAEHVKHYWSSQIPVHYAIQGPVPGTAQAVLSAAPYLNGPFGIANADDLYGESALRALHDHFVAGLDGFSSPDEARDHHLLVAYHVVRTILTDAAVIRGLCEVDEHDNLRAIAEYSVILREDGHFNAEPLVPTKENGPRVLNGDEWVSMNLWGFHPSMLLHLAREVATFDPSTASRRELLLPVVVGNALADGTANVHVLETDERCIGVTHADDLVLVSDELKLVPSPRPSRKKRSTGERSSH